MNLPTRSAVEDLLFLEADLLDQWKLNDWLALYATDARYEVPSTDLAKDADPDNSLFYIADDRTRLEQRVIRLNKKSMWSESPRSRTRHLVSNVRVLGAEGDDILVSAAFAVYRTKWGNTDLFVGAYHYLLCREGDALRIRKKRCLLDLDGLRPQGRVSILL
ncbi:aromatic-ring-hydroxylating dioxygenase subunit beta [Massilia sp. 9I]|uniref:aromatic-ring-hydroxylating dioxygenase subunit beta n=1 Tax=Massilia sp. 9I TaxID=2653152 RepID=UPI0012F40610|nr:aromatic-ring-hydroxylating dioxygenase subunit beta [Massilia sp. 9I]VXB12910.1 p-cumate 2,3-dioxygenase system, small oxygenase component [Massilia sp. 9I]